MNISKDTLPDYEAKIKSFYLEHIHSDDEIRYILDGSGEARGSWGLGGGAERAGRRGGERGQRDRGRGESFLVLDAREGVVLKPHVMVPGGE